MNSTVVVRANDQAEPSLVVFGRDEPESHGHRGLMPARRIWLAKPPT